jgi:hypothetical protein
MSKPEHKKIHSFRSGVFREKTKKKIGSVIRALISFKRGKYETESNVKVKVNEYHYKPGETLRVPGG